MLKSPMRNDILVQVFKIGDRILKSIKEEFVVGCWWLVDIEDSASDVLVYYSYRGNLYTFELLSTYIFLVKFLAKKNASSNYRVSFESMKVIFYRFFFLVPCKHVMCDYIRLKVFVMLA